MKVKYLLLGLLFLTQLSLHAQNEKIDSIDLFINKTLNEYSEIPGMVITIVKGDQTLLTKAYGISDIEQQLKSTTQTPYYIASVTKSFLGLLATQLESEGLFSLNDSITEFAPIRDFKDPSIFNGITLQDLLVHTSGIANEPLGWRLTNSGDYGQQDLLRLLEEETISRNNGKAYAYDNFGYHVFRLILEEQFGLNWKKLLRERVFEPMGMNHSTADLTEAERSQWNPARPYTGLNDDRSPELNSLIKNNNTMHAAGGIISSIEDMQNWLKLNINGGKMAGKQIFDQAVMNKMHSPLTKTRANPRRLFQDAGYGLGWNTGKYKEHEVVYHSGGFEGYYALCSFMPEEKLGIAIMVNETHFGDNVGNLLVSYAYDLLLGNVESAKEYEAKASQVRQQVERLQRAFAADRWRRSTRKWLISRELSAFSGEYYNEEYGLMKVSVEGGQPLISIGASNAVGSQSREKDAIRVEFRNGRGEDILFVFGKKNGLAAIYRNKVFYRN